MNRELEFLIHIDENEHISQRQLAKAMNISLGTVNGLIAQMIKIGYIRVEHTQAKQSKYYLTELGVKQKARMEYLHICDCYRTITKAKAHIKKVIENKLNEGANVFYLLGEEDEIFKLTKMALIELKREYDLEYHHITDINNLNPKGNRCILYWDDKLSDKYQVEGTLIL